MKDYNYIVCKICGEKVGAINHLHLRSHKITTGEYAKKYPNSPLVSQSTIDKRRKKIIGKPRSQETKDKLSISIKESWKKNPNQGRTGRALSDKSKKALSEKFMGHKVSDETRVKIGISGLGRIPWNKGLTKYDDERIMGVSKKIAEWNKEFMTDEKKEQISQTLKKRYANGMKIPNSKTGYRKDIEMSFRSSWDANYARILKFNDKKIDYENDKFVLYREDGKIENVYTPDFKIDDKTFIEVKGHADGIDEWGCTCKRCIRDKNKMFLMGEQYPEVEVILIGRKEYVELCRKYNFIIDNWEFSKWDEKNVIWKKEK